MKTILSTKGRIVLPVEIRRQDALEPGQEIEIERIGQGVYRLTLASPIRTRGLVSWLLDCPEKGYFLGIESESTDAGGRFDRHES